MLVLGIADNHDSGAAVYLDGRLVSAVNQERVDRVKNSGAFPWGAIDAALEVAGASERDVDRIVIGSGFTPSAALRAFPDQHASAREQGQFSPLLHAYVVYQSALRATGLHTIELDACREILKRRLKARPFGTAEVEIMDHHRVHAEAAYRTQGRPRALLLTVDAMGDGTSVTVSEAKDGQIDRIYRQSGLSAINTFYSRVTEFLGFTANRHEGKVTGLAAFVEPPPPLLEHLRGRLSFRGPGFSRVSLRRAERRDDPFWVALEQWSREEIAAAAQRVFEEAVTAFVRYWIERTGLRDVAVAGGAFANVKLNQRIAEMPEVDSLWVLPHMGDGGLAVGAVLAAVAARPEPLQTAYLGPAFTDQQHYKALSLADLPRVNQQGSVDRVVDLLCAGKVVARFDGAMEWGPRALGNRSILVRPDDPTVNTWLNDRLQRTEFMPFAPIVRSEDAPRYFNGLDKAPEAARFMTVCLEATQRFRVDCPGAVHVDGTARPQVLHYHENPVLYRVLEAVGQRTGVPVLINTSFNIHEEPIVCTPGDAARAWKKAKLDALWLGEYLVERTA